MTSAKKSEHDDAIENAEARFERYKRSYDVDTLARMCVETEDEYDKQGQTLMAKLARMKERNRRLVAALQEARTGFQGVTQKAADHSAWIDDAIKRNR
jgi:hypothetical protein